MKTALYFVPVLAVAAFLAVRADLRGDKPQFLLYKPLSTLLIIGAAAASFLETGINPIYSAGILIGLVLSLGGDIALMFDNKKAPFLIGLALFLAAHIAYGVVFTLLGRFSAWDLLTAVILIASALAFYRLIAPQLGSMKLPVIAYILIISLMVNRAFASLASPEFSWAQAWMVALGAALFYLSDVILAANRFWKPWKYHRLNLIPYYAGQYLLALAASYFG